MGEDVIKRVLPRPCTHLLGARCVRVDSRPSTLNPLAVSVARARLVPEGIRDLALVLVRAGMPDGNAVFQTFRKRGEVGRVLTKVLRQLSASCDEVDLPLTDYVIRYHDG